MRRLAVLAALVAAFFAPAAHGAGLPVVFFDNQTTTLSQQDLESVLPAFQTMVSRDLAPAWGQDAVLTDDPSARASAEMTVVLQDNVECLFCLGYHDLVKGKPIAYVGVGTSADYGEAWPLTATHELEEMLVDPWINRGAQVNGRWWLVEVSDPVESGAFAYFIDGVPISDFILPSWYVGPGAVDFTRGLHKHLQIGKHGYAVWWDPFRGWHPIFNGRPL